jgi:hypothetical protein
MHAIRSLFVLCLLSPLALGQTEPMKPGAVVTVRVVTIDDAEWPAMAKTIARAESVAVGTAPIPLTAEGVQRTLTTLQADKSTRVTIAPKATLASRQEVMMNIGKDMKFVTGLEKKRADNGKEIQVPKVETIFDGLSMTMTPNVNADGKSVQLRLEVVFTKLKSSVPLEPVTYFVTPENDGGTQGVPVPVTQFVQKPSFEKCLVKTTVAFAETHATMIDMGTFNEEVRTEYGPPVVSQVPYLNRLFKNQGIGTVKKRMLLIPDVEIVPVPAVLEVLADYQKAVKDGRLDDAKKHAMEALAINPACFAK